MNYVEALDILGVVAKEIPCIKKEGVPTETTKGEVGCFYMNTINGDVYKCTSVLNGIYTWVGISGDRVTPQMYGAKGDGKTDDTEAFNAALEAAAGKSLYVPAGKYLITSTLFIHDGTTLYGDGYGTQILTKVADGYVFNGVKANGVVSTTISAVLIRDICFDNKLAPDSITKMQPGDFIDVFSGSKMCFCRVLHYYKVFTNVTVVSNIVNNDFQQIYHCFCEQTMDSLIEGNYINASRYGMPHGSVCFEYGCNSLIFSNNFVDFFRDFERVRNSSASKFVGNTFSRMMCVFHDTMQNFTVTGNTFNYITYQEHLWGVLTEEQREQLANETWSVIKYDNEFTPSPHYMWHVTFANNVCMHPVDNYIYITDETAVYPANCTFRDNALTLDASTPSGVYAHFINHPALDRFNIMKNVYFDFWDMKEYAELPNPATRRQPGQPIFSFPYMRAVYKGNVYINVGDSWQKETHVGGRFSAMGEVLEMTDTGVDNLQELIVYGKSTQNGIPTPDAPIPFDSIGDDGDVDVVITGKNMFGGQVWRDVMMRDMKATYDESTGTVSATPFNMSGVPLFGNFAPKTQYTIVLTGYNLGENQRTSNLHITYDDGSEGYVSFPSVGAFKKTAVLVSKLNSTIVRLEGVGGAGVTVLYPDECGIFKGEMTADDFKAYTAQSMSISAPNGLRGIPVESGGNYTDLNGQQWISDEIDFSNGIKVQKVGKIENYANEVIDGAWLSTTGELTEGATVLYVLAEDEAIETPLTNEEIAAYKELLTYRKNSNIYSNDKAGIFVEYLSAGKDGVDWRQEDIALGVHSDGLLYIFIDGKPVGNGVPLGQQ